MAKKKGKRKKRKAVKRAVARSSSGKVCPECKGPARGRGFTHTASCSVPTAPKRTGKKKRRSKGKGQLAGMSLDALVELKKEVDSRLQDMKAMLKEAGV